MSITMIGLDTAKSVFQVHGVNETGKVEIRRKLRRSARKPLAAIARCSRRTRVKMTSTWPVADR